ncbi:signal peptide peptidase SppA [Helicobacter saguini]|uniref:Signal peptide peptidase SppA n=1 Tax=Helicobacter saguini TaxID=1548018 RepID=A0A347VS47_9HELI|nr:signal peptide peptidase SppA [Helicobacter saguini]MWV62654.1 signal peptide peptidase SppA [Helicobacter saguini]MWV66674.1 signal peptide peptidase SppA [Helicobacter saguini]MWV69024.1 signal peptide peptidase SppA [Helicobacter saguini]MWV71422.1 signal peptide peptidase SppA [Helicobacter saguini]TLD94072.1 signal peptide peptidase SppA [Helicobacter saguini]
MNFLKKICSVITQILSFFTTYFKGIILALILLFLLPIFFAPNVSETPNLAKLYLNFPIMEAESFGKEIEEIKKNPSIKGVLLVINSPGGAVGASVEIADMIAELDKQMPVVAYVQNLMASGAYYAGMYARKIYANRGTLIGSIGVIFSGVNIEDVMRTLGVKTQGAAAGKYKEAGTITRAWSADEREMIETLTRQNYEMFCADVISARGERLRSKDSKDFADGRVFNAHDALNLGLIDSIGSMDSAIKELRNLSGVDEPIWLKKDKFQSYIDSVSSRAFKVFFSESYNALMPQMRAF